MSSPAIHNVAVAGANGNLGTRLVAALRAAAFKVTILARIDSSSTKNWPADVSVAFVDYASKNSLVAALKGQDAVVSAWNGPAMKNQIALVDAAVEAGVYRLIPSDFGSDTTHPSNKNIPVFQDKYDTHAHLEQKAMENPSFTYTSLVTGPFLDYGLAIPLFLDCKNRKAPLLDGGDRRISTSTMAQAADAVVGVFKNAKATENRIIKVGSNVVTQNELLEIAERITGSKWTVENLSSQKREAAAYEELNKSDGDPRVYFLNFLQAMIFGENRGNDFSHQVENDLVGLKPLSPEEIEAEVAKAVRA